MPEKGQRILTKKIKETDVEEVSWCWAMNDKGRFNTQSIEGNAILPSDQQVVQEVEV